MSPLVVATTSTMLAIDKFIGSLDEILKILMIYGPREQWICPKWKAAPWNSTLVLFNLLSFEFPKN